MSWSGGTYTSLWSWVVDAVSFPNMLASRFDTFASDQATGINNCLTKDGQNSPTANLPMAGYVHTGVGNASTRASYPAVGQIQDGSFVNVVDTGAADAYVITLSPAITAYATGQLFWVKIANTNTGASTLNVNGLGVKSIKSAGTTDVTAGQLAVGAVYGFRYDGTNFLLIGSSTIADGSVTTAKIADDAVTLAKQAPGTANRLQGFDGSGNPSEITVNGATLSAGALTITGSGLVFISTGTAAASASLAFTGLSSTYKAYMVVFENVTPTTPNPVLVMRVSTNNGSSYLSTGIYDIGQWYNAAGDILYTSSTGGTYLSILDSIDTVGCNGSMWIFAAGSARNPKVQIDVNGRSGDAKLSLKSWGTINTASTAVNAIQFIMHNGSTFSGKIHLYGLA